LARYFIFLLLALYASSLHGQKHTFEFLTTADGIKEKTLLNPIQDDRGFLWVASGQNRIQRFDGYQFEDIASPPPSLPGYNETFYQFFPIQDSLLVFVSPKHLILLHARTQAWESFPIPGDEAHIVLRSYKMDEQRIVLAIYTNGGDQSCSYWIFENRAFKRLNLPAIGGRAPSEFEFDNFKLVNDRIYVSLKDQLLLYNTDWELLNSLSLNNLYLTRQNERELVAFSDYQLYRISKSIGEIEPHPAQRFLTDLSPLVYNVHLDENDNLWLTGNNNFLALYDARKDTLYNYQSDIQKLVKSDNLLIKIVEDDTGILWVNSRMGLLKIVPANLLFDTYFSEENDAARWKSFRGITEDDNGYVYAAHYEGIVKTDPTTKQVLANVPLDNLGPFDLVYFDEKLWNNSRTTFDFDTQTLSSIPDNAIPWQLDFGVFTVSLEEQLFWGICGQLFMYNQAVSPPRWEQVLKLPNADCYSMNTMETGAYSGKIWFAQYGQFYAFRPSNKKLDAYSNTDLGIPAKTLLTGIWEDPEQNVWITSSHGLHYFSLKGGLQKSYSTADGLPHEFLTGVLAEGDSALWLSSFQGLSRFSIQEETFINFFEEDGLSNNEFNRISYFKSRSGQLFFGGINGFNAFFPDEVMANYYKKNANAQVQLVAFERFDERNDTVITTTIFEKDPAIDIHYWDRSFTFTYTLTDFTNPEKTAYSYRMVGYEDAWSTPTTFNFTRFSSLPAGNYTFQVKARNYKGLWQDDILSVKVIVHPPWWETGWAYSLYVLCSLLQGTESLDFSSAACFYRMSYGWNKKKPNG
jgi:hypothetical protein